MANRFVSLPCSIDSLKHRVAKDFSSTPVPLMRNLNALRPASPARLGALLLIVASLLVTSGCGLRDRLFKRQVTVPALLGPLAEADTEKLLAEVNRLATVRSLRGRIDIEFLDTSFAECGVAEQYRSTDGTVTLQRPGQIFLVIQGPFAVDIAQMTSDGERFRVAVLRGDERYRRFVLGTNAAVYPELNVNGGAAADCRNQNPSASEARAVSALSNLRPQHLTDALLIRPVSASSELIYARSEMFVEEPDTRQGVRRGARVVRGYYALDELTPEGGGRAHILRRFWFDRFGGVRLARMQTFNGQGQLITDVVYRDPKPFGEGGRYVLPSRIELTRPQDRYSLRITYQSPETLTVDQEYVPEAFVLQNRWQLPEFDLDNRTSGTQPRP